MKTSSIGRSVGSLSALFCLCTPLTLFSGCESLVWENPQGSARAEHTRHHAVIGRDGAITDSLPSATGVFFTTVEFPPDYDWRRDTLYGAVDAAVCLYHNNKRILEVPVGTLADAASDRHHFVDGHLYTEFHSGGVTALACDGEAVLQFQGEETLMGIVPVRDVLYTLWQKRGGQGFCLRCGSEEILRRGSGILTGSFQDRSCQPHGALLPNSDGAVFFYCDNGTWFEVIGGREFKTNMPKGEILDVKYTDGHSCVLYIDPKDGLATMSYSTLRSMKLTDPTVMDVLSGRIYIRGSQPVMVCDVRTASGEFTVMDSPDGDSFRFAVPGCLPLSLDSPAAGIGMGTDGNVSLASENNVKRIPGDYFLLGANPGICTGETTILALNPRGEGKNPVLWKDGEITDLKINGFISGIYSDSQ